MNNDPRLAASSAARAAPGLAAGVDEPMIRALVHAFYAKLCDFWSSILLGTSRFEGRPMAVHARLEDIQASHFARWLELFEATARELWPSVAADLVCAKARQIGESLKLGIAAQRGELPPLRPHRRG